MNEWLQYNSYTQFKYTHFITSCDNYPLSQRTGESWGLEILYFSYEIKKFVFQSLVTWPTSQSWVQWNRKVKRKKYQCNKIIILLSNQGSICVFNYSIKITVMKFNTLNKARNVGLFFIHEMIKIFHNWKRYSLITELK